MVVVYRFGYVSTTPGLPHLLVLLGLRKKMFFNVPLGWFRHSQVWKPPDQQQHSRVLLVSIMRGTCKQLHTAPLPVGVGPSWVLYALKQPDLTPQEGPVALATETDPSCAPGSTGGFPTSEAGLLLLAFPGVGGGGAPSAEPEIQCSLLWGHQHQAYPEGHVVKELKPHWGIWQGGGHVDDPQVPGNHMPGAVWLWCLDQTLSRELLQRQSRPSLQIEADELFWLPSV